MDAVRVVSVVLAVTLACSEGTEVGIDPGPDSAATPESPPGPWDTGEVLPEPPPVTGDPVAGEWMLLNGDYMSCGLPLKLWTFPVAEPILKQALGGDRPPLPGRSGKNAGMPYSINVFTSQDGAEVLNLNCLYCHGGHFDGELIIGLGDSTRDFTDGLIGDIPVDLIQSWMLLDVLGFTQAERDNAEILLKTARAIGGMTKMHTVGNNPADSLARVLAEHRDPDTLAWSVEPLRDVVFYDDEGQPRDDTRFTTDPPPWWRAHKKNALFYNGMTRGPHRGTMEAASSLCVDNVEEAARVDALFEDMHAYVATIRAPRYTRDIDRALAAEGRTVFERDCAGCHGTYGDDPGDDDSDTYPNLIIPLEVVGTDPVIAEIGTRHAANVFEVYNTSFYGQVTALFPGEPFPGYTAPPLDGIWATGPFLHNGSVPNIALVLDSTARPTYWKRVDYDSTNFDEDTLGWPHVALPYGQDEAPADEVKFIYDTTRWSQSNVGHTFGDHLSDGERRAVIEYLKTL